MKKGSSVSFIVFGLMFVALGIFLFSIESDAGVVKLISAMDAIFGIILVVSGIRAIKPSQTAQSDAWAESEAQPEIVSSEESYAQSDSDKPEENCNTCNAAPQYDPAQLAAREGELREAAKRAADDAAVAKQAATAAINDAKAAEAELSRAEAELAQLPPVQQRTAMRQIDYLAQVAAQKAEIAVRESRRAKQAIGAARDAAELHSRAMDAAANAMSGDDEFAEFN